MANDDPASAPITSFGTPPHVRREQQARTALRIHEPPGSGAALERPARPRQVIVDEDTERTIQVLYSSLQFRPGEILKDPRKIQLAEEYGIRLRYRD